MGHSVVSALAYKRRLQCAALIGVLPGAVTDVRLMMLQDAAAALALEAAMMEVPETALTSIRCHSHCALFSAIE